MADGANNSLPIGGGKCIRQSTQPHIKRRMLILVGVFIVCFLGSFCIGRYAVPLDQLLKIFINQIIPLDKTWTDQMEIVALNVRLPRVLAACLIGGALSAAGAVYQGLFKNPLVSPDVLGSSAGAGFGAALGIISSFGYFGISLSSFVFGLGSVLLACFASARSRNNPTLGLVLAGIMIGSLFSASTSFIKLVADTTDELPAITYWLMGSLASIRMKDVLFILVPMAIGFIPLFLLRWRMNVVTLGDEEARALGINIGLLRVVVIFCATILTAASVSVSGMIGWVGLVIPHFARRFVGFDFKTLLPASILMGGAFLTVVDDFARTITTSEVPIGILTAFVGAPFFLYLILHKDKQASSF